MYKRHRLTVTLQIPAAALICVWCGGGSSEHFCHKHWQKMNQNRHKVPDHHEHLWVCSWRHQSPCWPDQRRPPWRPARRTSYGLGRSPVHNQRYIHHSYCILYMSGHVVATLETNYKHKASERSFVSRKCQANPFDHVSTQTSTVRWAMIALWCPSSVSSAIWAISGSDLPINIWQAVANISLFWPWIFTFKKDRRRKWVAISRLD